MAPPSEAAAQGKADLRPASGGARFRRRPDDRQGLFEGTAADVGMVRAIDTSSEPPLGGLWRSASVDRRAMNKMPQVMQAHHLKTHNLKVVGSIPTPATNQECNQSKDLDPPRRGFLLLDHSVSENRRTPQNSFGLHPLPGIPCNIDATRDSFNVHRLFTAR